LDEAFHDTADHAVRRGADEFISDLKTLLWNRDFRFLMWSFSIAVGFFNALLTLLYQIISPFGYRYISLIETGIMEMKNFLITVASSFLFVK
jgi:hypothetical protein